MTNDDELEIVLPTPHRGQRRVLDSKARFKVLMCGRRWGKSLICQIISIMGMIEGKTIAYVTPQYSLAKEFFYEIDKILPKSIVESANKSDLKIRLVNGGSISFLSGERLDNFRGRKFHTVVIDEAAKIPDLEDAWLNAIRPTLVDYQGNALFISTPRGKDYFYTLFLKGERYEDNFESFHYPTSDNPHLKREEIESFKRENPEATYQQEYLAIPNANKNSAVGMQHIEAGTIDYLSNEETVVYGIDVAKYTDYTCIVGLSETGKITYFEHFQRDNGYTKSRISALPSHILKVMDSTHGSIGDGIYESLQNEGISNLSGFEFTGASKPKLITEMILAIEKGELKYNKFIADELSVFEYTYSSTGHIKYSAISGSHDDAVIALALANRGLKNVPAGGSFIGSFRFGYTY